MPLTRIIIAALVALVFSGSAWAADDPIRWEEWDVYSCEGEIDKQTDGKTTYKGLYHHHLFIRKDGSEAAFSEFAMNYPLTLKKRLGTEAFYFLQKRNGLFEETLRIGKFGSVKYFYFDKDTVDILGVHTSASESVNSRCVKNPPTVFDYDIYNE